MQASGGERLDFQAFEELIGGNAIQFLEQLMTRSTSGRPPIVTRDTLMDISEPHAGSIEGSFEIINMDAKEDDRISLINSFKVMKTSDRWSQEAKFMYGSSLPEKSLRVHNAVVNVLMNSAGVIREQALADEKRKKDAADELLRDEELKSKKIEDDRILAEEILNEPIQAPEPPIGIAAETRITIQIGAQIVDITGFLENIAS